MDLSALRCAEASDRGGEPLAGTAAEARFWLAVEEPGAWAPEILASPGLQALAGTLSRWEATVPGLRIQLIRKPGRRAGRRRVFAADLETGRVTTLTLGASELQGMDLEAALAGRSGDAVDRPIHLVCTHGKRDDCCALRGLPLYRALAAAVGALPAAERPELWQTSHLGGHRFAATMVTLPHGYCLGRLTPEEAPAIVARKGLHDLARVRGRCLWPKPVQAADQLLRRRLGADHAAALDPHAVSLRELRADDAGWIVGLDLVTMQGPRSTDFPSTHQIQVRTEMSPFEQPKSCGDAPVAVPRLLAKVRS